jgi:KDO2-lipid IV(A) lauroyltransferase
MSEKKRSLITDYLVYLTARLVVCILQALSFESACRLAEFLAWVVYKVDKRHRQVAIENLQMAFPGQYTDDQIDRTVRGVYRHFCTVVIEFMHMPRHYHLHNYKQYTVLHEPARMAEALLSGRPILFVTGHFGNWEMAGYALGLVGFQAHAIARPLDNPYLDQFVCSLRQRTGQKLLAKQGDFDNMEKLLREGGIIATLADQDAGPRGLFVDFFGRPASTHKAVALLALEHNAPIIVCGTPTFAGKYHMWAIDVIDPKDYESTHDPVRAVTQRFTTGLEMLIRQAPEQYFWVHRRWKHAPIRKKPGREPPKPLAA